MSMNFDVVDLSNTINYTNHSVEEEEAINQQVEDNVTEEQDDETEEEGGGFTNGFVDSEDEHVVDEATVYFVDEELGDAFIQVIYNADTC